VDIKYKQNFSI